MSEAADLITACCVCGYVALESWCTLFAYGADVSCCGGQRGCCGSCCDSSFNQDDMDARIKEEQAKQGDNAQPVNSQPAPSQGMHVSDDAPPGNVVQS